MPGSDTLIVDGHEVELIDSEESMPRRADGRAVRTAAARRAFADAMNATSKSYVPPPLEAEQALSPSRPAPKVARQPDEPAGGVSLARSIRDRDKAAAVAAFRAMRQTRDA